MRKMLYINKQSHSNIVHAHFDIIFQSNYLFFLSLKVCENGSGEGVFNPQGSGVQDTGGAGVSAAA